MNFSPITWMIKHGIAPHLLMLALLFGGIVMSLVIRKEYMPETDLDRISVRVYYPGASPAELESSVVMPIEDALSSLPGISKINAYIQTGKVAIFGELEAGANAQKIYQDAQQAVNRISSFPDGIEKPYVNMDTRIVDVMEIVVHAEMDKHSVKRLTEQIRGRLLQSPYISQVKLRGIPSEQIHVEIPQHTLQAYNLSLDKVSSLIKRSVLEKSAGKIKSDNGDILVSIDERQFWAQALAKVPVYSSEEGDQLLLGDIAEVKEGFADERMLVTYNGQLSARLSIYRMGDQTPNQIADSVEQMWPELQAMLPPGAGMAIVDSDAKNYQKRLGLLLNNAFLGLLLVLCLMSLFLQFKLAFWVVAGIPSAFLGAMLFLPSFDVSINMVSMFGFIIAIGIVVDDAIIAGENIFSHIQDGMSYQDAAIQGAKEVAKPLTFAILTNIVAFLPLLLLPGFMKLLFGAIPIVVVLCFLVSWVEALFILPSHLANIKEKKPNLFSRKLQQVQKRCDQGLQYFIQQKYLPVLKKTLAWPGLTLACAFICFLLVMSYAYSGKMGFSLYPKMEGRWVKASFEISESTPIEQAIFMRDALEQSADEMFIERGLENVLVSKRSYIFDTGVEVALLLVESEERPVSTEQIRAWWREKSANLPGQEKLKFSGARRSSSTVTESSLTIEIKHNDSQVLMAATQAASELLSDIDNVVATINGMEDGKPQWKLKLNENGRSLGLDASDLAGQMRSALYGARAQRQHRLGNEVTTLVRLPESERAAANDIENLMIKTPGGGFAPLGSVATINKILAPARIVRRKGQRIEKVGAEVIPESAIPAVVSTVKSDIIPELEGRYPGLKVSFGGDQEQIAESVSRLELGTWFALAGIYILLAIAFKSYGQPLLIMAIIPFGAVGAILGHMFLDLGLSVVSLMGMLALAGVVVNDSLILIEYANQQMQKGVSPYQAILQACQRRFRPILLTTLTTFGGLAPMVFETSKQAQFIVPMAVSLGFGILFTTVVCLIVLPALFIVFNKKTDKALAEDNQKSTEALTTS